MVLQLILLIIWASNAVADVPPSLAKPGCEEKCGNVTIPYPFGMGKRSCYYDEWFEIDCGADDLSSSSSIRRPVLLRANLEVLEIMLPQMMQSPPKGAILVSTPIMSSSDCFQIGGQWGGVVNLTGSAFVFDQISNIFASTGCNNRALIANMSPVLNGCTSTCSNDQRYQNVNYSSSAVTSCSGDYCCQTTIPSYLQVFNVSFEDVGAGDPGECKQAFIVHKEWFKPNSSTNGLSAVPQLGYVPAVLEWGMPLTDSSEGSRLESQNGPLAYCYAEDSVSLANQNYSLQCYCGDGFQGNPYMTDGCKDVDECAHPDKYICNYTCENMYGYYNCVKPVTSLAPKIALASGASLLLLVMSAWRMCRFIKKRNKIKLKKMFFKRNGGLLLEQQLCSSGGKVERTRMFTSKELIKATDHFNKKRVLGQGGQGTVYKGMLPNGEIVAVKKAKIEDQSRVEQFINEVVILSQINHRNIVKLLGCCLETEVPLLVYEFVPNGDLFQYLHNEKEGFSVSWEMRLQIASEVSGAFAYLHSAASIPIYHRDIKSTNILLDDRYKAKVADFGTSRSVAIDQTHLTTLVNGTFGYLDPEYFRSSQFTDKSDVYSFGVVLVELLTGQEPISATRKDEGKSLAIHFIMSMEEKHLFDILDPQVAREAHKDEIEAVAELAEKCLRLNGKNRPTMREVAMELERICLCRKGRECGDNYEQAESVVESQKIETWRTGFDLKTIILDM